MKKNTTARTALRATVASAVLVAVTGLGVHTSWAAGAGDTTTGSTVTTAAAGGSNDNNPWD